MAEDREFSSQHDSWPVDSTTFTVLNQQLRQLADNDDALALNSKFMPILTDSQKIAQVSATDLLSSANGGYFYCPLWYDPVHVDFSKFRLQVIGQVIVQPSTTSSLKCDIYHKALAASSWTALVTGSVLWDITPSPYTYVVMNSGIYNIPTLNTGWNMLYVKIYFNPLSSELEYNHLGLALYKENLFDGAET